MRVKELIAELQKLDPECEIIVSGDDGDPWEPEVLPHLHENVASIICGKYIPKDERK